MPGTQKRTVSLPPEHAAYIDRLVSSGDYASASEVVREALRLLKERDAARDLLRADVQAGFDELAPGGGRTYDRVAGRRLADRIKSRGRDARVKKP